MTGPKDGKEAAAGKSSCTVSSEPDYYTCTVRGVPDSPMPSAKGCASKYAPVWSDAMDSEFGGLIKVETFGLMWRPRSTSARTAELLFI